jgi:hypothetical protein
MQKTHGKKPWQAEDFIQRFCVSNEQCENFKDELKVIILPEVAQAVYACLSHKREEVTLLASVELHGDLNAFVVYDHHILKQFGSSSFSEIDVDGLASFSTKKITQGKGEELKKIRGMFHSHPTMPPFLSGTDSKNLERLSQFCNPYFVSVIVGGKDYRHRAFACVKTDKTRIKITDLPVYIFPFDMSPKALEPFTKELDEKFEKRAPKFSHWGGGKLRTRKKSPVQTQGTGFDSSLVLKDKKGNVEEGVFGELSKLDKIMKVKKTPNASPAKTKKTKKAKVRTIEASSNLSTICSLGVDFIGNFEDVLGHYTGSLTPEESTKPGHLLFSDSFEEVMNRHELPESIVEFVKKGWGEDDHPDAAEIVKENLRDFFTGCIEDYILEDLEEQTGGDDNPSRGEEDSAVLLAVASRLEDLIPYASTYCKEKYDKTLIAHGSKFKKAINSVGLPKSLRKSCINYLNKFDDAIIEAANNGEDIEKAVKKVIKAFENENLPLLKQFLVRCVDCYQGQEPEDGGITLVEGED